MLVSPRKLVPTYFFHEFLIGAPMHFLSIIELFFFLSKIKKTDHIASKCSNFVFYGFVESKRYNFIIFIKMMLVRKIVANFFLRNKDHCTTSPDFSDIVNIWHLICQILKNIRVFLCYYKKNESSKTPFHKDCWRNTKKKTSEKKTPQISYDLSNEHQLLAN